MVAGVIESKDKAGIIKFLKALEDVSYLSMIGVLENVDGSIFGNEKDQIAIFLDRAEDPNYIVVREHEYWHHIYYKNTDAIKMAKRDYFDHLETYGFDATDEEVFNYFKGSATLEWEEPCYLMVLEPEGFNYVKPLVDLDVCTGEDAPLIDSYYTFKDEYSVNFIRDNIANRPSSMYRVGGEPASWVMVHRDNSIGIMFTREEYRGQKLAYQLSMDIIKKIVDQGGIPFIHVGIDNKVSYSLSEKCGFKAAKTIYWFGV